MSRVAKKEEGKVCPVCGKGDHQQNFGFNASGTRRCRCGYCGKTYTLNSKSLAYDEKTRESAIKIYYSGVSGRQVGKLFHMNKANVYNWLKNDESNQQLVEKSLRISELSEKESFKPALYELDELYWFINEKPKTETKENVYVMTMVTRMPRTIAGFAVAQDKAASRIQSIVDGAPWTDHYCTDGYFGYLNVIYPGKHIYNVHDKSNTFTVEGINADLRHYIQILKRRSRCFARSIDTLNAVVSVFVKAYNLFGVAKYKYRMRYPKGELPFGVVDFL